MIGASIRSLADHWVLAGLLLLTSLYLLLRRHLTSRKNMPPGPTPLPLIGNLHLLIRNSIDDVFGRLAKEYGDIFTFHLGPVPLVVLSSYELNKEALLKRGDAFSGRADIEHKELLLRRHLTSRKNMPPGPTPLPLIGNLHLLIRNSIDDVFGRLAKEYGDIFTFHLGPVPLVVLSSYELNKEALLKRGDAFSGRADIEHVRCGIYPSNSGVLDSEGAIWKSHRKFCFRHLGSFGFGKQSFEGNIMQEVEMFVAALREKGGQPFDIEHSVANAVSNVICCLVFGKRYEYGSDEFSQLLESVDTVAHAPIIAYLVPFAGKIPILRNVIVKMSEAVKSTDSLLLRHLNEHKTQYDDDVTNDLLDVYLHGKHGRLNTDNLPDQSIFEDGQIRAVVFDLFVAGMETTTTTVRWALLYLMTFPDIQDKMRAEIHDVVGTERYPTLSDRNRLPYTEAVIAEVQRLANVVFMALPHRTTENVEVNGYDIPADTIIIPNAVGVHMKEEDFPNPKSFRPERFLDNDGEFNKKLADKTMPFGIGKRVCLGEPLARMELFLFIATMIQRFVFKLPDGAPTPSLKGSSEVVNVPKPFKLRAIAC